MSIKGVTYEEKYDNLMFSSSMNYFFIHDLFKLVNQQALYKQVSSMIFKTDVICKLFQVHVPFMVLIDINVSLN